MCGIAGYCGRDPALPRVVEMLGRLEYRGYDSAGVAVVEPGRPLYVRKDAGKLGIVAEQCWPASEGTLGIGHTRWATHGKPTMENSHPHTDCTQSVAVCHNGIVENHVALRQRLMESGHVFRSETDTEVIPHLVEEELAAGASFEDALRSAVDQITGAHAIVAVDTRNPDEIIGVRIGHAGGLVVGYGDDAMYLASDLPALMGHVKSVVYLNDREMAVVSRNKTRFTTVDGLEVKRKHQKVIGNACSPTNGKFPHFMLKEIMEQPQSLHNALRGRVDVKQQTVELSGFPFSQERVSRFKRVVLLGMGTSYHAAMAGRYMMETVARIPCQVENASEFRYMDPVVDSDTLIVAVTQSGETVDSLAALESLGAKGAPLIVICNVPGSEATRVADYTMSINAGPEIGVASTKTATGSMLCLYLLSIYLGQTRGTLPISKRRLLLNEVMHLPNLVGQALQTDEHIREVARRFTFASNVLVMGRGISTPTALEGALKIKEISYIHAEGYAAGEMKHGPIALIDRHTITVAIALKDQMYQKMLGNVSEVRAREGKVVALATKGDDVLVHDAADVIEIPSVPYLLSPIVAAVPLQLLAYEIAVARGNPVDMPRNLAKTVTVE